MHDSAVVANPNVAAAVDHPTVSARSPNVTRYALSLLAPAITFSSIQPPHSQMWDAGDDEGDSHTTAPSSSKSSGFSLDDAFSEDDGMLDVALEFNPAAIRAALARTLTAEALKSTEGHNGVEHDGGRMNAGVSDLDSNHDRNGSVKVEDPDASVSTLDINAPPVRAPGRAPGDWSRSTSYSYGYGYRQDSQGTTSGVESLANFSRISLSDSVLDLESTEAPFGPSDEREDEGEDEGVVTEGDRQGLFRTVHIDLSQGGKPRVEELATVLPEHSSPHASGRDEARMPSPKPLPSPPLQFAPNYDPNAYISPSASTPKSSAFRHQGQTLPELPSQTTYHRSTGVNNPNDETNHISSDSTRAVLSSSSLGSTSSATASWSIPPPDSSQSEPSRHGGHRHSRSIGPSALDKVISRTRPTFLPPKPKTEDLKHMADWEAMMKQSRTVGECCFCLFIRSLRWVFFFHVLSGFKHIDLQLFFCPNCESLVIFSPSSTHIARFRFHRETEEKGRRRTTTRAGETSGGSGSYMGETDSTRLEGRAQRS